MALEAPEISIALNGSFSVQLNATPATGGTGPYEYQWYRDTSPSFTPSPSNDLPGKTELGLVDDTVLPGTQYYYILVATDTGNSDEEIESNELPVLTETGTQSQNKFSQSPVQGQLDLRFNGNTIAVQIDPEEASPIVASQAVMFIQDAGGVPKVTACTDDDDEVAGFINFDIKSQAFGAGEMAEMSMNGNVMYLVSTEAIDRGEKVMIVPDVKGGVAPVGASKPISGWAMDPAAGAGQLIRIFILTPALTLAPA